MLNYPEKILHHSGKTMTLVPSKMHVSTKNQATLPETDLLELGLTKESVQEFGLAKRSLKNRINESSSHYWISSKDGSSIPEGALARMREKHSIAEIDPVYKLNVDGNDDYLSIRSNVLLVEPASGVSESELRNFVEKSGLVEDKERSKYLGNFKMFRLSKSDKDSALTLAARLLEKESVVQDVSFETIPMMVPTAYYPNDSLYASQWNMTRIKAGGTGHTGWNHGRGDASVIICILDEGCDLGHPDLRFTPAPSGINLGTMSGDGSPTGSHGTACAGIAAARINNGEGVAGVAGNCTILPVAFELWSDVEVAAGIRFAADHGARVISMSFGWNAWDHAIINPAIQYAFDRDVVMCVATHNDNGAIRYPATNPLVMAIGASDTADERKSPSSPGGETWWGSNFGPQMSVVAPGIQCPTTDIQGAGGYNSGGNYFAMFNGTSAATPHVAGLAALLISKNPSLSNVDVREIIESNTDKVGATAYGFHVGYPHGTWNNQMGYGRINVHACMAAISKHFFFEKHIIIENKPIFLEVNKGGFKEKEHGDEVKHAGGRENPEIFDPTICEELVKRLSRLEQVVQGRIFIENSRRPVVGNEIASKAKKTIKE